MRGMSLRGKTASHDHLLSRMLVWLVVCERSFMVGSVLRAGVMTAGAVAMMILAVLTGNAQDTRTVSEPKIPGSCTQLSAQLRAVDNKLAEADEAKLDTARIQAALDKCIPG